MAPWASSTLRSFATKDAKVELAQGLLEAHSDSRRIGDNARQVVIDFGRNLDAEQIDGTPPKKCGLAPVRCPAIPAGIPLPSTSPFHIQ